MSEYVGLDVSLKETSVCVARCERGCRFRRQGGFGCAGDRAHFAPRAAKVCFETGPTSTWLYHELKQAGVPVVCVDARHAQAALSCKSTMP
jgi:transposase